MPSSRMPNSAGSRSNGLHEAKKIAFLENENEKSKHAFNNRLDSSCAKSENSFDNMDEDADV